MLKLAGVSKRFGAVEALRPLDLEIARHEWIGLFGHNGSGKTTLLRILLGLCRPTSGQLLLEGREPNDETWCDFRRTLGFMPERIRFYEHLTGAETLRYFAELRGLGAEVVAPMLESVGLTAAAERPVGEYSKGMQQRLNLAQALLGRPTVLILDEPLEGLDPQGVRDFFRLLQSGGPRTVVLSSHRLSEVGPHVNRMCVLANGEVKALGTVEELRRDLRMPVRVHIYLRDAERPLAESVLMQLGAAAVARKDHVQVAEVPQAAKTAFLLGLNAHAQMLSHLHVEEPSLEGVYFELN
ncbi:MAG: ABC transporter ATP-binding protein [Deltaproteobacteria bacterium]|nr:ABC transporter ATP-binding protein [Deltaproteobacteria bacterium]